jgi:hypothetical protein
MFGRKDQKRGDEAKSQSEKKRRQYPPRTAQVEVTKAKCSRIKLAAD